MRMRGKTSGNNGSNAPKTKNMAYTAEKNREMAIQIHAPSMMYSPPIAAKSNANEATTRRNHISSVHSAI